MKEILENIATYKYRYEYYDSKGSEEKCNEYISLILSEIEKLLALKDIKGGKICYLKD